MLVLTAKEGEEFFIGPDIRVKFFGTKDGRGKLGFDAPEDLYIGRVGHETKASTLEGEDNL